MQALYITTGDLGAFTPCHLQWESPPGRPSAGHVPSSQTTQQLLDDPTNVTRGLQHNNHGNNHTIYQNSETLG